MNKKDLRSIVYWWGVAVAFAMWLSFFVGQIAEETFVWYDVIIIVFGAAAAAMSSWFSVALLVGGWMFGSIP